MALADNRFITDEEFAYLGLSPGQISLLKDQDAQTRYLVYDHALRLLMERPAEEDGLTPEFADLML